MTPDHVHAWAPVDGECAQYGCACGEVGYRSASGAIRVYRKRPTERPTWTARVRTQGHGGRVSPRIADDYDNNNQGDNHGNED